MNYDWVGALITAACQGSWPAAAVLIAAIAAISIPICMLYKALGR